MVNSIYTKKTTNQQDVYNTKTRAPETTISSYNPKTGVLTSGQESYSVAPEKASALLTQVETPIKRRRSSSSSQPGQAEQTSQASTSQELNNVSQAMSSANIQQETSAEAERARLREAYLKSQAGKRALAGEETLAQETQIEQTAIRMGVDTRGRIESDIPINKEAELNRDFSKARQEFQDRINLAQNKIFVEGQEQSMNATYYFQGAKAGAKLVALGGASAVAGVVKGGTTAVAEVANVPLNVFGVDIGGKGNIITNTLEGTEELLTNPRGVYADLKRQAQANPISFATEQASYAFTLQKLPVVTKRVYSGLKSYVRRYEVAGSEYDNLANIETTGKEFYPGDIDIEKNIQTTLTGERVKSELLFEKTKTGPLKLEETSLYAREEEIKRFQRELESGAVVKGTNLIVPDFVRIPAFKVEQVGEVSLVSKDLSIKFPVRDEVIFGERYVGERTRTDFFPTPSKVETVLAENIAPSSKPLFDVKTPKGAKIIEPDYLEIKEPTINKDVSVQKKLRFEEGTDKFIGANIGLFTEGQKMFTDIKAQFDVKVKAPSVEYPGRINGRSKNINIPPILDIQKIYSPEKSSRDFVFQEVSLPQSIGLNDLSAQGENISPSLETGELPGEKEEVDIIQVVKPRHRHKVFEIQEVGIAQEPVFEPVSKPIERKFIQISVPTRPFKPEVYTPKIKADAKVSTRKVSGYDVFVRKKGKFQRVNIGALSKTEALNLGAFKVGTSASASFKIEPSRLGSQQTFKGRGLFQDFYKKGNIFIEKRERRIKSAGEKQEITMKGLQAQKFKKMF